jgi:hypothetical protein
VGVRTFIEDKLLTTTGYRDSCALDDALSCPDVTQPILNELVNQKIRMILGMMQCRYVSRGAA